MERIEISMFEPQVSFKILSEENGNLAIASQVLISLLPFLIKQERKSLSGLRTLLSNFKRELFTRSQVQDDATFRFCEMVEQEDLLISLL